MGSSDRIPTNAFLLVAFLLIALLLPTIIIPTALAAQEFRVEHDLLGEIKIPANAYYGIQTARALENFKISGRPVSSFPALVEGLAVVKLAAARANHEAGALDKKVLAGIEKAVAAILDGSFTTSSRSTSTRAAPAPPPTCARTR